MYIVPDLLELRFPQINYGYFSSKEPTDEDKLNILSNWICHELTTGKKNWIAVKRELRLEENSELEIHFLQVTGLHPREFARLWKNSNYTGHTASGSSTEKAVPFPGDESTKITPP